ncbi:hypothetical protein [Legionella fairfieldensis]|uniref:hypothetical protein n=1 Tax=Legionella fairfieldensis TaxID=45064 RepID=UPI000AE9BCD2|nr:hypothetical protein [Legionella fairfieldensis]
MSFLTRQGRQIDVIVVWKLEGCENRNIPLINNEIAPVLSTFINQKGGGSNINER